MISKIYMLSSYAEQSIFKTLVNKPLYIMDDSNVTSIIYVINIVKF